MSDPSGSLVFSASEEEVPQVVQKTIDEYLELCRQRRQEALIMAGQAIEQFATSVFAPSSREAEFDLLGAAMKPVLEHLPEVIFARIPETLAPQVLGPIVGLVVATGQGIVEEVDRATRAGQIHSAADWIKEQRRAVNNALPAWNSEVLSVELGTLYLEADDRQDFFEGLFAATGALQTPLSTTLSDLELDLWEQWLNANFVGMDPDAGGCVAINIKIVESGYTLDSCNPIPSLAGRAADALNQLITLGNLRSPMDMNVRKRVAVYVPNLVGGTQWASGWLDQANNVVLPSVLRAAEEVIVRKDWWSLVTRFTG